MHKRSAEDWGGPCDARSGRPLERISGDDLLRSTLQVASGTVDPSAGSRVHRLGLSRQCTARKGGYDSTAQCHHTPRTKAMREIRLSSSPALEERGDGFRGSVFKLFLKLGVK
jgi:hypothetical protein